MSIGKVQNVFSKGKLTSFLLNGIDVFSSSSYETK